MYIKVCVVKDGKRIRPQITILWRIRSQARRMSKIDHQLLGQLQALIETGHGISRKGA
jgi:hypothetical protein